MARRSLLAADIGGTRARFMHVTEIGGALPADAAIVEFSTREQGNAAGLLSAALTRLKLNASDCEAVFAVAGPVRDGKVRLTNLGWDLDESALRDATGFRSVRLLNDLEAAAWTLAENPPHQFKTVRDVPARRDGRDMVVSVSTGLGVAYWQRAGGTPRVTATEGGHVGFAPSDTWETDFLRVLQERHGTRISWERMLSGSGLAVLEAHIRGGAELEPAEVTSRAGAGDAAAQQAIRRFSRLVGVFVGDRVLGAPVTGTVWLMGGVLSGLDAQFHRDMFLEGLDAKGRLSPELTRLPVRVTEDDFLGLHGAYYAARAGQG